MLPFTCRLPLTLFQYSRFNRINSRLRHYSTKASQPLTSGLVRYRNSCAIISAIPSLQSKVKDIIEEELKDATYYVDLTTEDGILYADPKTVEAVTNNLGTTFEALTSGGDSSSSNPRLPVNGFHRECQSYEPFVHLLNKIIDTANLCMPRSQLSELRFHTFGGKVKEIYGTHEGLKPDIVGITGELSAKKKRRPSAKMPELSWEEIEVNVECKALVKDMVRQSGTYARCCLLSNRRRFFALGIGFHYKTLEAYVFVFHRSGLSSSRPLKLTTSEGFKGLVSHMVGILSFKDEAAYGLDTTLARFQNMFRINNRNYEIVRLLYVRGGLRGRSTTVYSLQGMYICGF